MSAWHEFEGRIEPMEWGRSTYTILRIPGDVADALTGLSARRVEGEIGDHPINLALTKAPAIEGMFLYTGKALLAEIGIEPGEGVSVRLRPADPDNVETPADVAAALRASGRAADWEALSPGKRRGLLHGVTSARRAETRRRRIDTLLSELVS